MKDYKTSLQERLKDTEYANEYLAEVLANESNESFLIALKDVIDAREENISKVSEIAGITRQTIYQALSENGNPTFSTITKILDAIGLQLSISEIDDKEAA